VWLSRDVAPHLQRLARSFQLVWCTAWENHAAEFLAPHLGLPALPVIHFDEPVDADCHWKWPAIEAFTGDRAFAWIDDEIAPADLDRARARRIPARLVVVDGGRGLGRRHVEQLERFARSIARARA
jgi:hypothetical protein